MFIYFRVVSLDELVYFFFYAFLVSLDQSSLNCSFIVLIQIQITFQKPMIKIKSCYLFKLFRVRFSIGFNHIF